MNHTIIEGGGRQYEKSFAVALNLSSISRDQHNVTPSVRCHNYQMLCVHSLRLRPSDWGLVSRHTLTVSAPINNRLSLRGFSLHLQFDA